MGQGIFGNRKQFGNTLGSKKVQKTKKSKSDIIKSINKGKTNKLPENESLYKDEYDLKYGKWPTKSNECIKGNKKNLIIKRHIIFHYKMIFHFFQ